ncbi:MAG: phosphohistidine phosphatase SixA [Deltaproteobacteria bacterium]|nr:phosphohistidine phosphatase SixA [Deltaproteobacteria bacterium]
MLLYLVRHAEAKKEEEDPERGLTLKGLSDIEKAGRLAAKRNARVRVILHSSKKRARETAEVLARHLNPGIVAESDGLNPLDDPKIWFKRLSIADDDMMLVGHMPHLSILASFLLNGDAEKGAIDFMTAGIVCFKKLGAGAWAVDWTTMPQASSKKP